MIFKYLILIVSFLIASSAYSAECQRYETMHPTFLLDGSHLQAGKCSTCASCHINGVFVGTPKSCLTCHNGDPSRLTIGRASNHIPTGNIECSNCHNTTSFTTTYTMNHASVISIACETCHNGTSYASQGNVGALGVPINHIPYKTKLTSGVSMTCNICHVTTVYTSLSNWDTLSSNSIQHNGTMGSGNGWCIGCHLTGLNYLSPGIQRMSLTHHTKTPVPTDCSQVGCHRPLGNTGKPYIQWDN